MYFLSQFFLPFYSCLNACLLAGAKLFAASTAHTEPVFSAEASPIYARIFTLEAGVLTFVVIAKMPFVLSQSKYERYF